MKTRVFHSFSTLMLGLTLLTFSSCRLDDKGPHAEIYPQDGSTGVPVNTVIEIQYAPELGVKESDMKKSMFSINECTSNTFKYFTDAAKPKAPADPASSEKKSDDKSGSDDSKNSSDDSVAEPTKGKKVNFYLRPLTDANSKIIFNYLVINPEDQKVPLKYNTTYCVEAKKIKNEKGEQINSTSISFTTEDSANFEFDAKYEGEFLGNTLAPSRKDTKGVIVEKDFVLLYFPNEPVRPEDVKKRIKLCKEDLTKTFSNTQDCGNDFSGYLVDSEIMMIEDLITDQDKKLIPANYNLYGITSRSGMIAGEKYKVILNYDAGSDEETYAGKIEQRFEVQEASEFSWPENYGQIAKGSGKGNISIQQSFYIGVGSSSSYTSSNASADNSTGDATKAQATF